MGPEGNGTERADGRLETGEGAMDPLWAPLRVPLDSQPSSWTLVSGPLTSFQRLATPKINHGRRLPNPSGEHFHASIQIVVWSCNAITLALALALGHGLTALSTDFEQPTSATPEPGLGTRAGKSQQSPPSQEPSALQASSPLHVCRLFPAVLPTRHLVHSSLRQPLHNWGACHHAAYASGHVTIRNWTRRTTN